MYRSFVTCDDPKGVVECGTIRKSKVASMKMEEKSRNRRDKSSKGEEMARSSHSQDRGAEDYSNPCSFQLLEVSRGARKLNELIDSWSRLSYEANHSQPKDVARELLKGALDLQDSLAMLGKLQEAKHYVSKLKKKQKEKVERGRHGEVWCERTNSYRFGFDEHRVSSDGSSGDAIEELRNAIKDGFARQNLLRSSMGRGIDSVSCDPSSSSSHSTDSLMSKPGLPKKGKAPNLIAKLMGLEGVPSEPLAPFGHIDKEKKKLKADFDIEVLKARKSQPLPKMVESRRTTTLEEILQTAQCEGLIRSSSAKEHKSHSNQPTGFHSRRKSVDDVHPIVLIKPMRVPCYDPEQALGPIVRGNSGIDPKMILRRMRIKQGLGPGSMDDLDVTPRDSRMHFEREMEFPNERIIREEGAQDRVKVDLICQRAERAVTEKKVPRKVEPEKTQVRRHSYEEISKEQKPESKRTEEKEAKTKRRDSSPSKAEKQLKEEIKDKRVDKVQRVVSSSSRKPIERESLKAKIVLKSDEESKLVLKKPRKPENGSVTKQTTQAKMSSSKDQKHKGKPAKVNTAAIPVPTIVECKEEEKIIDVTSEVLSTKKEPSIEEEDNNIPVFRVEEQCGQSQDSMCSITLPSPEISSPNKAEDEMTVISVDDTSHRGETRLKKLLLNNLKFVNLAENLFHLNQNHSKIPPLPETNNEIDTYSKISSDYAEEFIERRSLRDSQTKNPLLLCTENPSISMSTNQLVEEIRVGIEALEGYGFDENRVDSIYGILERDMRCGGLVSGVWDLGWRNGFTVEDVEQSVKDLEVLILGELIEEVFC